MIAKTHKLYAHENTFLNDINHMAYALNKTTIDICFQMFPWAKFRQNKGYVKIHALLDMQVFKPTIIKITPRSVDDVKILDQMQIKAGALNIMDMVKSIITPFNAFNNPVAISSLRQKTK